MSKKILDANTALLNGNNEYKKGELKKAINFYKQAVGFFEEAKEAGIVLEGNNLTNFTNAYVNLGATLIETKDFNGAVEHLNHAIGQVKTFAIHYGLGSAYLSLQQYTNAIDALTAASNLVQAKPEVYYNLGLAYKLNNDNANAIKYFQEAKKLSPQDFDTLYNLGVCLKAVNKPTEAVVEFKKALAVQAKPETLLSAHCKIIESQMDAKVNAKTLYDDLKVAFDYAYKMSETDKTKPEHKDYLNFISSHFCKSCLTVSDDTSKDITRAMVLYKTINGKDELVKILKNDAEFMFNDSNGSKKTAVEILTRLVKYCENNEELQTGLKTTLFAIAVQEGKEGLAVKIGGGLDYEAGDFGFTS